MRYAVHRETQRTHGPLGWIVSIREPGQAPRRATCYSGLAVRFYSEPEARYYARQRWPRAQEVHHTELGEGEQ